MIPAQMADADEISRFTRLAATPPKPAPPLGERRRLGEILIATGELTGSQLEHALSQQPTLQLPLGQTLLKLGYTTDEIMRQALSTQLGVPYIDLANVIIDRSLAQIIDADFARRNGLLPVARIGSTLTVAMDDPTARSIVEELSRRTAHTVTVVTSSAQALQRAIGRLYDKVIPELPTPPPVAPPPSAALGMPASYHSYAAVLGLAEVEFADLLRVVEQGLSYRAYEQLVANSGMADDRVIEFVDISRRTLARRKREGRFTREESDRLLRAARLFSATLDLFKHDRTIAVAWLLSAQPALGGRVPLELTRTDLGAREVEGAIARLRRAQTGPS